MTNFNQLKFFQTLTNVKSCMGYAVMALVEIHPAISSATATLAIVAVTS